MSVGELVFLANLNGFCCLKIEGKFYKNKNVIFSVIPL